MAAWLLVLMRLLERHGGDVSALGVDKEFSLPELHLLHGTEALVCVIFNKGLYGIIWEVHHAEEPYCESDLARDIPHVDWIELSLPDRLHLAADAGDPDPIEAEGPDRLLEPGNLGADVVLRPLCFEDVFTAHRNKRPGFPGQVSLACHNSPVDDPLLECINHEGGGDSTVLCFLEDLLIRAPCRDACHVFAEIRIFNHPSHLP